LNSCGIDSVDGEFGHGDEIYGPVDERVCDDARLGGVRAAAAGGAESLTTSDAALRSTLLSTRAAETTTVLRPRFRSREGLRRRRGDDVELLATTQHALVISVSRANMPRRFVAVEMAVRRSVVEA